MRRAYETDTIIRLGKAMQLPNSDIAALLVISELYIDAALEESLDPDTRLDNSSGTRNGDIWEHTDIAFQLLFADSHYRQRMFETYDELRILMRDYNPTN